MGNNTGPVILLGLLGLLLVLWMKRRQQPMPVQTGGGSPGLYGYGRQAVGGLVSLTGAALRGAPPAVDYAGNLINKVSTTGAGVVNTGISAAFSVPKGIINETGGLLKSAGSTAKSTTKSFINTVTLGALF